MDRTTKIIHDFMDAELLKQEKAQTVENRQAELRVRQPSELLPCPFCGSAPTVGSLGGDKENWMIYCECCKIPSAEMGVSGETLEEIKKNWNKRVSQ